MFLTNFPKKTSEIIPCLRHQASTAPPVVTHDYGFNGNMSTSSEITVVGLYACAHCTKIDEEATLNIG